MFPELYLVLCVTRYTLHPIAHVAGYMARVSGLEVSFPADAGTKAYSLVTVENECKRLLQIITWSSLIVRF